MYVMCVFLCKQKTAYEVRISDWSSDVCSSDLDDAATVDAKWREALHVLHAEPAAYDTALAHDLFQHIAGGGQRDGEADAVGVGPALGEHCGIDADQMAQGVDQCTAGVAAIDRGVGLDEVLERGDMQLDAAERGNDEIGKANS